MRKCEKELERGRKTFEREIDSEREKGRKRMRECDSVRGEGERKPMKLV